MRRGQLEKAAANYWYLRGLFFIPLGALLVLSALGNWQVGPLRHPWAFLILAVVIGASCIPINRYYNDNYGRISPSTSLHIRGAVGLVIGVTAILGGSSLLRSQAPWSLDLPVNAIAVCFAIALLASYGFGIGLHAHHVAIWGALLIAGALPVWNGSDPSNIGLLLAGIAVAISGALDHRLFVQTFGLPDRVAVEEGDVGA
jgi:hypothetical protein